MESVHGLVHLAVAVLGAVAYAAFLLRPLGPDAARQPASAARRSAALIVGLRVAAARRRGHRPARRADRRRHRSRAWRRRSARRCSGPTPPIRASPSCTASSCWCCRISASSSAARKGEWLEPARLVGAVPRHGPQQHYKILDTSVIIDGRIADICETGLPGRHAGDPAVRAQGAAAGRRLLRLDEAQPRPPRPRHPAEDPEDGGRRRHRSPTSTFPRSARSTSS